jgi:uncharacterized protein (TIGR04255 family)
MTERPADLPDFANPPVTEVVMGVQFDALEGFLAPHLGLVWSEFKSEFPIVEEHPPLEPVFEMFPSNPNLFAAIKLELITAAQLPRIFFVNQQRTELLQFQRDRLVHNWRKVGEGDQYPRFERMLETFKRGLGRVSEVLNNEKLGAIVPNQCEVSYINQIPAAPDERPFQTLDRIFGRFSNLSLSDLGPPEDARFLSRYVIVEKSSPIGRLIVSAEPARRPDGTQIVQLTLTARGRPFGPSLQDVEEFLERGRFHVVRAFAQLTSGEMHKIWGRQQ